MKRGVTVLTLVGLLTLGTGLAAGPAGASPKAAGHATAKGISGDTVKIRFFTFRPNLFYADALNFLRESESNLFACRSVHGFAAHVLVHGFVIGAVESSQVTLRPTAFGKL